jgi:hypothetical protein
VAHLRGTINGCHVRAALFTRDLEGGGRRATSSVLIPVFLEPCHPVDWKNCPASSASLAGQFFDDLRAGRSEHAL